MNNSHNIKRTHLSGMSFCTQHAETTKLIKGRERERERGTFDSVFIAISNFADIKFPSVMLYKFNEVMTECWPIKDWPTRWFIYENCS